MLLKCCFFVYNEGTSLWLCTGFSRLLRNFGLNSNQMEKLFKITVQMRSNTPFLCNIAIQNVFVCTLKDLASLLCVCVTEMFRQCESCCLIFGMTHVRYLRSLELWGK